jgi:hypothetical protein
VQSRHMGDPSSKGGRRKIGENISSWSFKHHSHHFLKIIVLFKMPQIKQTLDAEQGAFDSIVKEIQEWWATPRQFHIKR